MKRYILKRLILLIPIMLGVTLIVFCIRAITPGSPVDHLLGDDATAEQREELEAELGLDDPLPIQFVNYVKDVVRGDLGESYTTGEPVMEEILSRFPITVAVCFSAVFLGTLLGVPLGIFSATRPYTWIDSTVLVVSIVIRSIPAFCLAFFLISIFSVELHLLPSFGVSTPLSFVLPVAVIGLTSMCNYTRITRSSMLEIIRQDYIRTARAKGQSEHKIIYSHALRNAAIPIVNSVGNQIGHQLGGALILETVFGIPGVGKYIGDAISTRNFPAVQGGVLFLAFIFTVVNLLTDLSFTAVNPRLKSSLIVSKGRRKKQAAVE